jgi:hypothetical protein
LITKYYSSWVTLGGKIYRRLINSGAETKKSG